MDPWEVWLSSNGTKTWTQSMIDLKSIGLDQHRPEGSSEPGPVRLDDCRSDIYKTQKDPVQVDRRSFQVDQRMTGRYQTLRDTTWTRPDPGCGSYRDQRWPIKSVRPGPKETQGQMDLIKKRFKKDVPKVTEVFGGGPDVLSDGSGWDRVCSVWSVLIQQM